MDGDHQRLWEDRTIALFSVVPGLRRVSLSAESFTVDTL